MRLSGVHRAYLFAAEHTGNSWLMADRSHDARLVPIPPEHLEYLRDILARRGGRRAEDILQVSRHTMYRVLAVGAGMPGTAALIREAIRRRDQA